MTILTCTLTACALAWGDSPPKGYALRSREVSPSGAIQIEHYANGDRGRQIWVSDSHNPTDRAILYEYGRGAKAIASEDDKYIAVTDYAGSDISTTLLFVRTRGVHYSAAPNTDIEALVWREVARQYNVKAPFDHSYCEVSSWLGKTALLIHAWGHMSGEYSLEHWFAVYDIRTRSIQFDLKLVNDRDVERPTKKAANTALHGTALPRSP